MPASTAVSWVWFSARRAPANRSLAGEGHGFGDAPEHGVDAEQQFECFSLFGTVGFFQVGERVFCIGFVQAQVGDDRGA